MVVVDDTPGKCPAAVTVTVTSGLQHSPQQTVMVM